MIRVLFVDDEPAVLEGLENRFRRLRRVWDMCFVASGHEALAELAHAPFDVIVSDMRMPVMDGAQLLEQVRERYPDVVRFILSGQTGGEGLPRLMPIAHQLLAKPCDAGALERAVERICGLNQRLLRPAVQRAIGSLKSLPALPKLYWDLVKELENPQAHAATVARIIEQDVAMTARLLQMANSVFFGQGRPVSTVKDSVALLGYEPIRSIVLSLQLVRAMEPTAGQSRFSIDELQQHSLQVAQLASSMMQRGEDRHNAFSAGMLHDLGDLIFATSLPDEWTAAHERATADDLSTCVAENAVLGCDHADVGAQMLNRWGLPMPLVEAVACHHLPSASGETHFGVIGAVHVANLLVHERAGHACKDADYDEPWLVATGVADLVAAWRRGIPITPVNLS